MKESNKNRDLQLLLEATPEQLTQWASEALDQEPLPSPESLEFEVTLAQALVDPEILMEANLSDLNSQSSESHKAVSSQSRSKWGQHFAWLKRPMWYVPALTSLMLFFIFRSAWLPVPEVLSCKGNSKCTPKLSPQHIHLHLGVRDPSQKNLKRLGDQGICYSHQNIYFGFSLQKKGYITLWIIKNDGSIEWLYSPKDNQGKPWNSGFQNLMINGQTQFYSLKNEKGPTKFVVSKGARPFTQAQRKYLQQSKGKELLERLSQLQSKLQKTTPLYVDYLTLHVRKKQ